MSQKGFSSIALVITIIVAFVAIGAGYFVFIKKKEVLPLIPEATKWTNAYEEGTLVYRNSKYYSPPPSRFRHSFIYRQGECESLQLAPNDAHYFTKVGCSTVKVGDTTIFKLGYKKYEIQELTNEKMVLREIN